MPDALAPAPSLATLRDLVLTTDEGAGGATAHGVLVGPQGEVPAALGVDREALTAAGFDGTVGATLVIPATDPVLVAVGSGDEISPSTLRDAAAALGRATAAHERVAMTVPAGGTAALSQAAVEGLVLARYRYDALRSSAPSQPPLAAISLVGGDAAGAERGRAHAAATAFARDLANTPHSHLSATGIADLAVAIAPDAGLEVEVFGRDELVEMGCGGLLGVNAGSVEPPRMIKLTYRPEGEPTAHLGIVGKGIMYDSGGLSLKPGNEVHAQMKNDMSGAAAVLAAMSVLRQVACPTAVTAWLMCTDNMPSGTAMALGDVITMRGGTTVEVINTDAEGRLVMADALVLAVEEGVDAVVDIATLTGACMAALGTHVAGVMGNHDDLIDQIRAAGATTDESVWPLPLERRYRSQLDSTVADMRNLGGPFAGAITAALFLAEFVGDLPWAHIDMAGTAQTPADTLWHTAGCSGFGARLLVSLASGLTPPAT